MMIVRHISFVLGALVVAGCAIRPFELPETHPANPVASEAPPPPESTTLGGQSLDEAAPEENEGPSGGHGQHGPPDGAASFECPMHLDVQQARPGKCPRCGMTLVRKEKGDGKQQSGHAH